jgi:predicted RNA polymerase sigma factor
LIDRIADASEGITAPTECSLQNEFRLGDIKSVAEPDRCAHSTAITHGAGQKSQEGELASGEVKLASGIEGILPSAKDFMKKLALTEMEEAAKQAVKDKQAAAEKQALLDQLKAPSGLGDEEAVRRGVKLIERAVSNGLTEVQVYRFPNALCTDHGRAINQQEPGWETTLTGVPKEIYLLWERHFKARGYKLRVEIVNFPGGMPGDIGMTLKWS